MKTITKIPAIILLNLFAAVSLGAAFIFLAIYVTIGLCVRKCISCKKRFIRERAIKRQQALQMQPVPVKF